MEPLSLIRDRFVFTWALFELFHMEFLGVTKRQEYLGGLSERRACFG